MVTLIKYGALGGGEKYNTNQMWIDGLSTDTKPTTTIDGMGIPNGSVYTEVDTGKTYMFDKDNTTWYEVSLGGGGGGGFTPTTAQLDAMNSGIDSTKVAQIATNETNISTKANTSYVNTATANLQGQINQIVISASSEAVVAPEVAAARSDKSGVSYSTLKERIDTESDKSQSIENDLIATGIISLDKILDYRYQNTLNANTVEYARLGSYNFQQGKTYKIIVDFTSVTWKSTNDAYVEIVALDANSYTVEHIVERIREQNESLTGNKLEIIYVPTVNDAKYINFKFNLGAGTQNITVNIYERKASEVNSEVEAARTSGSIEYSTLKDRLDASDNAIASKSNQTEVDVLNENLRRCQRGYNLLPSGYERGGMITSGANSGKINVNEKYRVSSSDLLYADTEQMIYLYEPNIEYNFYPCNSDGTVIRTSNWQTKGYLRVVEAGTYYKITLQRNPKNTSEVLTEEAAKEMWESIGIVDSFSEKQLKYSVSDLNTAQKLAVQNFSTSLPKQLSNVNDSVPLELLHFSDVHANRYNWDRICKYINDIDTIITAAIHTGDYVAANQQSMIDLYSRKLPNKIKIFNVVGNHDSYADNNNTLANKSSTYNICFSNTDGWGVTFGTDTNAMYYYKDYLDSSIRLIVLDQYYWDATEAEWLATVLEDARENDLSVVTAMHTPTETIIKSNQIECTFKEYDDWTGTIPSYSTPVSAILKNFIDNGGLYICNLCGHFHFDIIGYDSNGVLNVTVPCATYDDSGGWQTTKRIPLEKSGDCFNIIGIDVTTHTIRIARIGSNFDYFGQAKNILCIDYTNGTVLANS